MDGITECELRVIEKLIAAFSQTLSCYSPEKNESEVLLVENVLQVLLSQNESLYNGGGGSIRGALDDQELTLSGEVH